MACTETAAGRVVGVILMLLGIGIVGTLAASIAAHFIDSGDADDNDETARLRARVTELEAFHDRIGRIEENQRRIEGLIRSQRASRGSDEDNREAQK